MLEYYPQIRLVHIAAVLFSGSLFALRGLLALAGRRDWALAPPLRYLSYAIDTTLLTAALILVSILPRGVFANGWLTAKLALLPAYIALGLVALRHGGRRGVQATAYALALGTFLLILGIARSHDPLGPLRGWLAGG